MLRRLLRSSILVAMCSALLVAATHAAPTPTEECTFDRGTTRCVSTTQHTETDTHQVVGGCVAGPAGVPGRRTTTYLDTYLVTETTTTSMHGLSGKTFDSQTSETRVLIDSHQISSVCEPI